MAARGRKNQKGSKAGATTCPLFLAVRKDVLAFMIQMKEEKSSSVILEKWLAMAGALISGQERNVTTWMRILDADKVGDVWELGPKRRHGGAFRLFMTRQGRGSFFITAAVEKSQGGVREIGLAQTRAGEIASSDTPESLLEVSHKYGREYEIYTDALALIKECRGDH